MRRLRYPKVRIEAGEPGGVVRALKEQDGKDIWLFGGGVLFRTLLEAGAVDRLLEYDARP